MTFVDDDGNEIETSDDVALTKQSVTFFNAKIKGNVSTTFQIDNNSKNRKTLGYYGPQMINQVAYVKQAFNRKRNGNFLDRGFIVIQSDNGGTLSCFYLSGNSNWFQLLDNYINELDFTGVVSRKNYLVPLNTSSINDSVNNTDGIIFPLVDWGSNLQNYTNYYFVSRAFRSDSTLTGKTDSTLDREKPLFDLYPCFYLSSLVDEIILQAGLKKNGNLFDDKIYKSIVLTPDSGEIKRQGFKNISAAGSSQIIPNVPIAGDVLYSSFTEQSDPDDLFINSTFTADRFGSAYFYINVEARSSNNISLISIYQNGVSIEQIGIVFTGQTLKSNLLRFSRGDYFQIYVNNDSVNRTVTLNLRIEFPELISPEDWCNPSEFLPKLKQIDIIKFVVNYFGCSVYYNDASKTISINIIDKLQDTEDWSEFYITHKIRYTLEQAQNNYLKFLENQSDSEISAYNKISPLNFADGNIRTGNTLKSKLDIANYPFQPISTRLSKSGIYISNIPLVNLIDEGDPIPFTGIASQTVSVSNGLLFNYNEVVRITDDAGFNYGYFVVSSNAASSFTVYAAAGFSVTNSGKVYKQKLEYRKINPTIAIVTNVNISYLGDQQEIIIADINNASGFITNTYTSFPFAYFAKQKTGFGIDSLKYNLAIDNPTSGGFEDPTIKELYFNKISRFLQNPDIECQMILSESAFQRFKFDRFIYLKTEKLTGYFFVESIENYVDSNTPVTVTLYML